MKDFVVLGIVIVLFYYVFVYKENIKELFKKDTEFIMYYADWCPHCQTAKPYFKQLKDELNGNMINGEKVIITMVDADAEKDKVEKAGVGGFPTFHLVKNGTVIKFDGERDYDGFKKFLEEKV